MSKQVPTAGIGLSFNNKPSGKESVERREHLWLAEPRARQFVGNRRWKTSVTVCIYNNIIMLRSLVDTKERAFKSFRFWKNFLPPVPFAIILFPWQSRPSCRTLPSLLPSCSCSRPFSFSSLSSSRVRTILVIVPLPLFLL